MGIKLVQETEVNAEAQTRQPTARRNRNLNRGIHQIRGITNPNGRTGRSLFRVFGVFRGSGCGSAALWVGAFAPWR